MPPAPKANKNRSDVTIVDVALGALATGSATPVSVYSYMVLSLELQAIRYSPQLCIDQVVASANTPSVGRWMP